jgi:hypothetical protein
MPALDRANIDPTSGALLSGAGADITAIPSAAYTTTQTSSDIITVGSGVIVVLDCTVNAGGLGSVTLTIQGRDTTSGKYYTLLAGAAVTSVSTNVYTVAPALTAAANSVANMVVPRTIRVLVTANNANPMTYSVGASVIAA